MDLSDSILAASDNSVALVLKRKQVNPTCDNTDGGSGKIYSWSKLPIGLVLTPCSETEYTDRTNVSLQMTTKR